MKKPVKAALWSIFILPGSGHFYLKKPVMGSVIVAIVCAGLSVVVFEIVERAMKIVDKILLGEIPYDPFIIAEMVSKQSESENSQWLDYAWYVLVSIWIIAAIDAYRLARVIDKNRQEKN